MGLRLILRAGLAVLLVGAGILGFGAGPAGAQSTAAGSGIDLRCLNSCFHAWVDDVLKCQEMSDPAQQKKCYERAEGLYQACISGC